jgi:hypothetical protein
MRDLDPRARCTQPNRARCVAQALYAPVMGATEDALVRYVVREVKANRPLAEVMQDPYITNRADKVDSRRLLDRPEVIAAVGDDVLAELRSKLGLS